jgi:ABC-type cobalamin transport system permease subunit
VWFLVGITAAVATHTGFILRVLFTGSLVRPYYSGYLLGATVLIILSIYMGPVDPQVDYYYSIQSILCCAYITTLLVIFINSAG